MSAEAIAAAERRAAEAEARASAAEEAARRANEARAAAESALEQLRAEEARRTAQAAIGQLIAEADLPEPSRVFLREALANETNPENARTAIERQRQLVAQLTESRGGVRGMGDSAPAGGADSERVLVEAYMRLGHPEDEARRLAEVR